MLSLIGFLLVFSIISPVLPTPFPDGEKTLHFHSDGSFRIMQINDFQDTHNTNEKSLNFLNTILDRYQPDLVVLVGDQLENDGMTEGQAVVSLLHQLQPLEDRQIPFLYTFGNHDHDNDKVLNRDQQAAVYDSFSMSYATHNGPDAGTYNKLIYSRNGATPILNIYMMDTNEWYAPFTVTGVNPTQVQWYKDTSDALKASNHNKIVPSLCFQHIPVKEMFYFLKEVAPGSPGSVGNLFNDKAHVLDETKDLIGDRNVFKEGICCENPSKITGQYQAWVEKGDIIGAFFGHDHVNTFVGRTDDGIVMGYNGGFGFNTYGDGDERFARIYDFNENDVTNYTMKTLLYSQEISSDIDIYTPKNPITIFLDDVINWWKKLCIKFPND